MQMFVKNKQEIVHCANSAWKSCGAANKVCKLALRIALNWLTQGGKKGSSMSKWKGPYLTIGFGKEMKERRKKDAALENSNIG